MPAVAEPVDSAGAISPRKRWTRAECESLPPELLERVELVGGDLLDMGKDHRHWSSAPLINLWLVTIFGVRRAVFETPIDVDPFENASNEPVPDLLVLRRDSREYTGNPPASEVSLAVEVADSSLRFDLGPKADLYARAGIPDYWVVDVNQRRIVVHRDPREGRYRSVLVYGIDESVAPLAAPDREFPVRQAFE